MLTVVVIINLVGVNDYEHCLSEQCYALGWNSSILCLEMLSVIVIIDLDGVDIPHWYISLVCLLLTGTIL